MRVSSQKRRGQHGGVLPLVLIVAALSTIFVFYTDRILKEVKVRQSVYNSLEKAAVAKPIFDANSCSRTAAMADYKYCRKPGDATVVYGSSWNDKLVSHKGTMINGVLTRYTCITPMHFEKQILVDKKWIKAGEVDCKKHFL